MLLDIKRYITVRGRVSLRDLTLHFDADPEAMRGMLEKWISKGQLAKCDAASCGGCTASCSSAQEEAYEWVGTARVAPPLR
ncbi:MAG: FeoC-like transcriptional regulator [Pseudomonadota bacterium]|nr:FeoC-like transcriptional regulator [Pseudomonadota bacterium]